MEIEENAPGRQRVNLTMDSDAVELLDLLAGGERKRGVWLSNLIRSTYAAQTSNADLKTMDVESLRLTVIGLNGRLQSLEGEMARLQTFLELKKGR